MDLLAENQAECLPHDSPLLPDFDRSRGGILSILTDDTEVFEELGWFVEQPSVYVIPRRSDPVLCLKLREYFEQRLDPQRITAQRAIWGDPRRGLTRPPRSDAFRVDEHGRFVFNMRGPCTFRAAKSLLTGILHCTRTFKLRRVNEPLPQHRVPGKGRAKGNKTRGQSKGPRAYPRRDESEDEDPWSTRPP